MHVAIIGGFGAPPGLLTPLARSLRASGHDVSIAPLGMNVDCGSATLGRLDTWLVELAVGGPVAIVGHSRGGQLGRVTAVRRPELVERLVTVMTPWTVGPPDKPGVAAVAAVLRRARRAGIHVPASLDCGSADCCTTFRADLDRVPSPYWVALWSTRDRLAGRDAWSPAGADRSADIGVGHIRAVTSPQGKRAIANALVELR